MRRESSCGKPNIKYLILQFSVEYGILNVALFDIFTLLFYLIYLYLKIYISILSEFITIVYFSICIQYPFISIAYFPFISYILSFVFYNFHYYFIIFISIVYFNICILCLDIYIYWRHITILSPFISILYWRIFIVEGISPLQQSPLSFAVIIDCSGLRSSRYEMKTWWTSLIFTSLQTSFARKLLTNRM